MWGPLTAFCSDSGSCSEFPLRPTKGRVQALKGNGEHYEPAPRRPPTPEPRTGGISQSPAHPSYQHRGAQGCATVYTRGAPSIPLTGAPGTGRRRPKSEDRVLRPQSRGGAGSARSQGEVRALSVYPGAPPPRTEGTPQHPSHPTILFSPRTWGRAGCTLRSPLTSFFRLAGDRPPRRSAPVRPEGTPEDETCK